MKVETNRQCIDCDELSETVFEGRCIPCFDAEYPGELENSPEWKEWERVARTHDIGPRTKPMVIYAPGLVRICKKMEREKKGQGLEVLMETFDISLHSAREVLGGGFVLEGNTDTGITMRKLGRGDL